MNKKHIADPSSEWLDQTDEIEAACESFAAAGLASRLGMVDREIIKKQREVMETATRPTTQATSEDKAHTA